jgi:hypothetical protein
VRLLSLLDLLGYRGKEWNAFDDDVGGSWWKAHLCLRSIRGVRFFLVYLVYGDSEERELPSRAYVCSRFDVECIRLKQSGDEEGVSQEFGRRVVLE